MNNKYTLWYNAITESAKTRVLDTYTERHHILPECLGGTNEAENLVDLTAREHFICHWLLTKITADEDRYKMLNALRMMRAEKKGQKRYKTKITARVYAHLKEEYAQLQSIKHTGEGNGFYGKHHTEEAKEAIRQKNLGNRITDEQRAKISAKQTGKQRKPFSDEWKENLSKNHRSKQPGFDGSHSEETRAKQRAKAIGRKQSPETIAKKSAAIRGSKREKKICPYCNNAVAVNGYARWHGDNCKMKGKE